MMWMMVVCGSGGGKEVGMVHLEAGAMLARLDGRCHVRRLLLARRYNGHGKRDGHGDGDDRSDGAVIQDKDGVEDDEEEGKAPEHVAYVEGGGEGGHVPQQQGQDHKGDVDGEVARCARDATCELQGCKELGPEGDEGDGGEDAVDKAERDVLGLAAQRGGVHDPDPGHGACCCELG